MNEELEPNTDSPTDSQEPATDSTEASEFVAEEKPRFNRSTLVMFAIAVLAAGGFYLMYKRVGPSKASAAIVAENQQAKKTIESFLGNGTQGLKLMETMLKNTEKVVQQFLKYPSMTQVPLADLRANPFRQKLISNDGPQKDDGSSEKKKREEERVATLKAVQAMQLQSVMCSETRKACMINGVIYMEGQQVSNFSIEKITATSVIVKSGAYRFELKMQR